MNAQFITVEIQHYPLIDRFYKAAGEKARAAKEDRVFALKQDMQWLAAARLVPKSEAGYLLRNLTVMPGLRRQGLARQLMLSILVHLDRPLYCYALPWLETFYRSLGFAVITADAAPQAIAEPYRGYSLAGKDFVLMRYNSPTDETQRV